MRTFFALLQREVSSAIKLSITTQCSQPNQAILKQIKN